MTLEALARILGETSTPGLVVAMDELGGWVKSFDAYHQRGERQRWLALWSGAAVKVDRATRGPVFVERPVACVVGCITPDCLHLLEAEARQEDGFVDRILYAFPDTKPMRFVDAPPPRVDLSPVFQRLRRSPAGEVLLSEEARRAFRDYVDRNAEAQERESFRPLRRYRAKLPRHLARLALVLHCLRHPDDPAAVPLARETMEAAAELAEYFLAHAHRVLLEFGDGALARRVLETLVAAGGQLSLGQLHAQLGGHIRAADLRAVRDFLASQRVIEVAPLRAGPRGGRTGEVWRLAPSGRRGACEKTEKTSATDSPATTSPGTLPPDRCLTCGQVLALCECPDDDPGPDGARRQAGPTVDGAQPEPPSAEEGLPWPLELAVEVPARKPTDRIRLAQVAAALLKPTPVASGSCVDTPEDAEAVRARRRKQGLCEGCGGPLAVLGGKPTCSRCGWRGTAPSRQPQVVRDIPW